MVLVKSFKFCEGVVLCKIQPEKEFADVLVRKKALLDNINMYLKKKKRNWLFCPRFWEKVEAFSSFVFMKNRSRKSVC